jgi:hypothetical protein
MGKFLRDVVKELHLEMKCSCCGTAAAWYEYARHGYPCQFIMAGGSIEELFRTMGHDGDHGEALRPPPARVLHVDGSKPLHSGLSVRFGANGYRAGFGEAPKEG